MYLSYLTHSQTIAPEHIFSNIKGNQNWSQFENVSEFESDVLKLI
jgi:hypothetical protein